MLIKNNSKKYNFNQIIFIFLLHVLLLSSCTKETQIKVFSPSEIDTVDLKNIAVGDFEIGHIILNYKNERNGIWQTHKFLLDKLYKASISRSIRARVVNWLTATPYFRVIFSDEFEKLENDDDLSRLISSRGYKIENVDALISGKIWLEIERTDGVDLSKEELVYFKPPRSKREIGLNLAVDQVVWWPYKSVYGTLGLEIKMTRLNPTEIIANTFESRTFSQRIGGKSSESFKKIGKDFSSIISPIKSNDTLKFSETVLPAFDQIIADLALSIASGFVKRVSVSEKIAKYTIAKGTIENSRILIEAGAFDLAIEELQKTTANDPDPNDLYNLGLCFEAIGDYGLAQTTYKEAWEADPENLLFAEGLGRIEKLMREKPKLQRQLESR